jgi:hypothetical protein
MPSVDVVIADASIADRSLSSSATAMVKDLFRPLRSQNRRLPLNERPGDKEKAGSEARTRRGCGRQTRV